MVVESGGSGGQSSPHRSSAAGPRSGAVFVDNHAYLTTEEEVRAAGGVGPDDRVEVSPWMPEKGRLSFATSDVRAMDLEAWAARQT